MLASDVEYRLHQVIEEAARFMRHGRRTTLTTADIDNALRVLNIEPLYGHSPHAPLAFRRAPPVYLPSQPGAANHHHAPSQAQSTSVYFVEDEEIDFDNLGRGLREEKIQLPKPVSWTAHWLAVEGVQPAIPENPPPVPIPRDAATENATDTKQPGLPSAVGPQPQLVKQVLSRELQLYYTRLTSALLPPLQGEAEAAKRAAALASLRHDAGLQALLPYLVRWVGEGVVAALKDGAQNVLDGRVLEVLLDVIGALLDNQTLFVEPYLHQLLPPILSILLHSSLPPALAKHLRTSAASTLSHLLTQHSTTYPSLSPRIMKTLLLALVSPDKGAGTREGAIRGLVGVGKEAVRKGLVEGGGVRVVGAECATSMEGYEAPMAEAVMDALRVLSPPSENPVPVDPTDEPFVARIREVFGEFFGDRLMQDGAWARSLLEGGEVLAT
ncbi:hypothetical protein PUNSTDRAFT_97062 [Punctularia strigosozonata HHB-11173 SS5]|uniref:uncharacterized protein n=1 Tax=Punctularia strigosozonata (strain HHB-11173) TaxID=741275 RepID=UPI0004417080|nr:uncharacterized protein PUNSTDRAFT_97062 [Punctularia strigosozonata HHB-11173 SS5]EIN12381.1 hypothetical protein PUNSTDRAFT_97062 [Punctularia strigosozonata HHB-11173 SS5]